MNTVEQFIKSNNLSVEWHPVYENPNMGDMPKGSVHFKAIISTGEKGVDYSDFGCYYSCGPGIVEGWAKETNFRTSCGGSIACTFKKAKAIHALTEFMKKASEIFRPELGDLLDCLASDCSMIARSRSFADWADDLGYDNDSIKARRTYDVCNDQYHEIEQFLGRDALQALMYETERL